ncbi:uncharacterized protein VTP21DRAFT_562 [Calcarisporiella thermophila]|uniref:uncharacterized protein n=1 Tax=Calcarisporiella thermophila TaxID=911321 RepID=UPI0037427811
MDYEDRNINKALEKDLFGGDSESELSDLGEVDAGYSSDEAPQHVKSSASRRSPPPGTTYEDEYMEESEAKRPTSGERKKKKKSRHAETIDENELADDDPMKAKLRQLDRDFKKALSTGRSRRRKHGDYDLEEGADEIVDQLRNEMKDAVQKDQQLNADRKPAITKIVMLPHVLEQLRKTHLHEYVLDNNLLEAVRMWLEPLPDRSLPSLDIQMELLKALDTLPIRTEHLKESRLGRIVMFYAKVKRVDYRVQRLAQNLVYKWSRPIINKSANYKDKQFRQVDFDPVAAQYTRKPVIREPEEPEDVHRVRARIPLPDRFGFDIVPRSTLHVDQRKSKEDPYKNLKSHMSRLRASQRKGYTASKKSSNY